MEVESYYIRKYDKIASKGRCLCWHLKLLIRKRVCVSVSRLHVAHPYSLTENRSHGFGLTRAEIKMSFLTVRVLWRK